MATLGALLGQGVVQDFQRLPEVFQEFQLSIDVALDRARARKLDDCAVALTAAVGLPYNSAGSLESWAAGPAKEQDSTVGGSHRTTQHLLPGPSDVGRKLHGIRIQVKR